MVSVFSAPTHSDMMQRPAVHAAAPADLLPIKAYNRSVLSEFAASMRQPPYREKITDIPIKTLYSLPWILMMIASLSA